MAISVRARRRRIERRTNALDRSRRHATAERRFYLERVRRKADAKTRLLNFLREVGTGRKRGFRAWRVPLGAEMREVLKNIEIVTGRRVSAEQTPKSMLVKAKVKGKPKFALIVLPWDRRIDRGKVEKLVGKKAKLASGKEVEERTGYPIGSVCPIPLSAAPLTIIIDSSLAEKQAGKYKRLYFPLASPTEKIGMSFDALIRAIKRTRVHKVKQANVVEEA